MKWPIDPKTFMESYEHYKDFMDCVDCSEVEQYAPQQLDGDDLVAAADYGAATG
jgi:hypothetical protein